MVVAPKRIAEGERARRKLSDDPGVRLGAVGGERLIVGDEYRVDAVARRLIDGGTEVMPGNNGSNATTEGRGEVDGLRQQLERDTCRSAVVQLADNPHARLGGE